MARILFSQTITGQERKVIASVIAEALGTTATYAGPPSFGYTAGGWSISKNAKIVSPEMDMIDLTAVKAVMRALSSAGLNAEGTLRVSIFSISETEAELMRAVIKSKETLLKKALQTNESLTVLYEDEEAMFPFFMATLSPEKVCAYLTLVMKIAEFAKTLKYTSAVEKVVDNEKYAFRCFLLRLGFIGAEYKTERKVLLAPLEGNAAFKAIPTTGEGPAE